MEPNIRNSISIEDFINSFPHSSGISKKSSNLINKYHSVRLIKSSVNSFYLATMYSYLELITILGAQQLMDFLDL